MKEIDAIEAVTHHDPYPYYATLVAERPFHRDEYLAMWIATSAEAIAAVLTDPACQVRPQDERIPRAIEGTPAAKVFGNLARMNDGEMQQQSKAAIEATIKPFDAATIAAAADRHALVIAPKDIAGINDFAFTLPAYVLGTLLGIADEHLPELASAAAETVRAIFPGGTPEQVARGAATAGTMLDFFDRHQPLLMSRHAPRDIALANTIGFFMQAYDAAAGLITITLVTLARARTTAPLPNVIDEVLRFDSPLQNTRRFAASDATILGQSVKAGDTILVVLAAANRDPSANPDPHVFDPYRATPQLFSFGIGPHACPGRTLATTIARAAIERLLRDGLELAQLDLTPTYRPSPNIRIANLRRAS